VECIVVSNERGQQQLIGRDCGCEEAVVVADEWRYDARFQHREVVDRDAGSERGHAIRTGDVDCPRNADEIGAHEASISQFRTERRLHWHAA
jgi:hypothetical protein